MNPEKDRKKLFQHLRKILDVSQKKFSHNNKKDKERRAWARISIRAVNAYGKLLQTHELEQMARDIEMIEQKVGVN